MLRKISGMRKEITSLKECRPPSTERDTEDIGRIRNSPSRLQCTDLRHPFDLSVWVLERIGYIINAGLKGNSY